MRRCWPVPGGSPAPRLRAHRSTRPRRKGPAPPRTALLVAFCLAQRENQSGHWAIWGSPDSAANQVHAYVFFSWVSEGFSWIVVAFPKGKAGRNQPGWFCSRSPKFGRNEKPSEYECCLVGPFGDLLGKFSDMVGFVICGGCSNHESSHPTLPGSPPQRSRLVFSWTATAAFCACQWMMKFGSKMFQTNAKKVLASGGSW